MRTWMRAPARTRRNASRQLALAPAAASSPEPGHNTVACHLPAVSSGVRISGAALQLTGWMPRRALRWERSCANSSSSSLAMLAELFMYSSRTSRMSELRVKSSKVFQAGSGNALAKSVRRETG